MKFTRQSILFVILLISAVVASQAQTTNPAAAAKPETEATNNDAAAIKQAALNYIEGWYNGDSERMERAASRTGKTHRPHRSEIRPQPARSNEAGKEVITLD